jgi:diguanylate cyclase (GGDEF)-like protein
MLLALLIAWGGGLVFAWRTSDRILRPLSLLEQTMRGWVGRADLSPVDPAAFERSPREIASLAISFQQLGGRLRALMDQLEDLAHTDSLTGVGNRRRFDLVLQQEWLRLRRVDKPLSLLMIDVDHFKAYNDTYGHGEGDRCLVAVAAAIQSQGRRSSDITCRIGGEEFALLLPETDLEQARVIAEHAWRAVQELAIGHRALGERALVSVSIGVAMAHPALEPTPDALQQRADRALYRRKRTLGRNGVSVECLESGVHAQAPQGSDAGDEPKASQGLASGV